MEKSSPVCLFLRWLIQGAELGVGLFPLGRNRAAPFTVRKLSLILEGKRKEKRCESKPQILPYYLIIFGLLRNLSNYKNVLHLLSPSCTCRPQLLITSTRWGQGTDKCCHGLMSLSQCSIQLVSDLYAPQI